jgi:hypothetical protein
VTYFSDKTGLPISTPILPYPHVRTIKATPDMMGQPVMKGDKIDLGRGDGYFVVIAPHFLGQFPLLPGQSNDAVHWAVGPSSAGA